MTSIKIAKDSFFSIAELVIMAGHYLSRCDLSRFSQTNRFINYHLLPILWAHMASPWPLFALFDTFIYNRGAWRIVGSVNPANLERFAHYARHVRRIDTLYQRRLGNPLFEEIHPSVFRAIYKAFESRVSIFPLIRCVTIPKALNLDHFTEHQSNPPPTLLPSFHLPTLVELEILVSSSYVAAMTAQIIEQSRAGVECLRLAGPHLLAPSIIQSVNLSGLVRKLSLNFAEYNIQTSALDIAKSNIDIMIKASWNQLTQSILKLDVLCILHPPKDFCGLDVLASKSSPSISLEICGPYEDICSTMFHQSSQVARAMASTLNCVFLSKASLAHPTTHDILEFVSRIQCPTWGVKQIKIGIFDMTRQIYRGVSDSVQWEAQRRQDIPVRFYRERPGTTTLFSLPKS